MRKMALVLVAVFAFSPAAMAYDIAFYVGSPNFDGWYTVAAQTKDVETIIAKTGSLFKDVQKFDDSHLTNFGVWVDKNMNDGEMDIIWLNGCTPSVLYQYPNVNADGSRAEKWLDGGNMIINVGDWFAYCSYEGGARKTENGATGAANVLDLNSAVIAGSGQGEMAVTPAGKQYLPSLNAVTSDRPIQIGTVTDPWEVAEVFAQNADGTYADPVVIHNTLTDGYVVFINQASTANWIADRGLTCAEFIGNWVKNVIGFTPKPFARSPVPFSGSMIDATKVTAATWQAGDLAVQHDVYFGDNFDAVSAATPADTAVYFGRQTATKLPMGMAGGPMPTGLVPGTTYYWRVDEINPSDPASPWKGEVWSLRVRPLTAWEPTPADGGKYVLVGQLLTWNKGFGALVHYVSIGEDLDAVKNAPPLSGTPSAIESMQIELKPGTTYYWRVDEYAPPKVAQGEVWSFTTVPPVSITDPHLVGYWAFDEGTSDTALDSSGYGHHGVLSGGIERTEGYFGGALRFGDGKVVNCGVGAAEQVTADFTLAAWARLNPGNAGIYGGIAGKLQYATNYYGFALVRHSGNAFRLWVGDGTADLAKSAVSSNALYTDTEWHHVAGVHSGASNYLYVDGVKQTGTSGVPLVPSSDWFHIGRQYSTQADRTFPGLIDDVRVYDTAASDGDITAMMRGNVNLAGNPEPANGAEVDIRSISQVTWSPGAAAASHDVYFGADRKAVTEANKNSPEFKGNRSATSLSLSGLVAFGGGDYYWRIDEVAADGTTAVGYVWKFTVPAYLIVDDFDEYSDDTDSYDAVFQTWLDGFGYNKPVVTAGNGTTSTVGYAESLNGTFGDAVIVNPGGSEQSMPFDYNNLNTPYYAEASRTWSTPQDWTKEGVTTLVLYVKGVKGNDATQPLYVALENQGKTPVVVSLGSAALSSTKWMELKVPLSQFTGVNPAAIKKMYIGVGDRSNAKKGGHGMLYIDDIRLIKP